MRESWTDERLDEGFANVTSELRSLRGELGAVRRESKSDLSSVRKELKAEISAFRAETNARFEHFEGHFEGLQRTLLQVGGGIIAALLGILATQL